ncbi:hypothetical protein NKG95_31450 [Mesorhizobium sp. M1423]|uniref:hypothetical protein n=1 Tax=Mesorhizobium sp. M1423 TaxID=2957101 RepID=UPI003335AA85
MPTDQRKSGLPPWQSCLVSIRFSKSSTGFAKFAKVCGKAVGLPLSDLKMSRIRLGGANGCIWRNVVVADAAGPRVGSAPEPAGKSDAEGTAPAPPDDASDAAGTVPVRTAIGLLEVAPLPLDTKTAEVAQKTADEKKDEIERRLFDAATAAAIGDRSGVSDRTFFLLADSPAAKNKKSSVAQVRRLYADVALMSIDTALPGTSDSALAFAGSHFRLIYTNGERIPELVTQEAGWNTPDGFLWLGQAARQSEAAAIDLGGATLVARRDQDLVDLRFRFSDFVLAFSAGEDEIVGGMPPVLRPAREDCRMFVAQGHVTDSRPILSVEFAPQHVMEEAFFRPKPEPLPDTEWPKPKSYSDFPDLGSFLAALQAEPDLKKRAEMRHRGRSPLPSILAYLFKFGRCGPIGLDYADQFRHLANQE